MLKSWGFAPKPSTGTSHEQWVGERNGQRRLVTVDCPKAPFSNWLFSAMLKQAGSTKVEFYEALKTA